MKTTFKCVPCFINQALNLAEDSNLKNKEVEEMIKKILTILKDIDYNKNTPPHLAKRIYPVIYKLINTEDPYRKKKKYYNEKILEMEEDLYKKLDKKKFKYLIKMIISGNIIDFGVKHSLKEEEVFNTIDDIEKKTLKVDDSNLLKKYLKESHSVMIIGDNCGEIVFDKIFIRVLKERFPQINKFYYGVRGYPVINDITMEDGLQVGMDNYAELISNGDNAPGTIMDNVTEKYQEIFNDSDVIIAKGQGNFESLSEEKNKNLFFLLMAKCSVIADKIGVDKKSLVCKRN